MTDRHAEGIEKAAEAVFDVRDDAYDLDEWEDLSSTDRERYECDARAAVTAYLDHAHPTITTVAELDDLPGRLTVMDDDGEVWQRAFSWSGAQWHMTGAPGLFHTGGIPLPARVIHWGDR